MKKAIVTGGAGFLGSHLTDKLLTEGYEVFCVDNLLTGDEKNLSHLNDNPKFKFIKKDAIDVSDENFTGVSEIFHLASPASPNFKSPKSYHALFFETMRVNTEATWKLAELALKNGSKFLFASTSEIYGDPLEHPQKESYRGNVSTTGPRSVYDEAKRFGETITSAFVRKGLDGRIIRIFNTYGPRVALDDGRVVNEFVQAALKNEPLTLFGDGLQTRSFCYVSDLIEGIFKAMNVSNTKGEAINLGNPGEFTILELAEKIKEITNSESEIVRAEELPEDDPKRRCPDISKAKELLDWEPRVTLDEGLGKLIEYIRNF